MERLKELESAAGAWLTVDGAPVLSFGGCCYLGLACVPELTHAGEAALEQFGTTAPVSRHYGFCRQPNRSAEMEAQRFFGTEDAMYFSTGYLFGAIALAGLVEEYDVIFLDDAGHYSLHDGAMATGKPICLFRHMDADDLERCMREHLLPGQRPVVATDGMFPTFGSIPPLDRYQQSVAARDGWLVVDESHSFGDIGPTGCGAVEQFGLDRTRIVAGGSLGKAFCAFGGLAIGSERAMELLRCSHPARGTTSGISAGAAMSAAAFRYVRQHPEMLEKLRANTRRLKTGLRQLGLSVEDNDSPISTFTLGTAGNMVALQKALWEKGIFVGYTTYVGSGPEGAIRCAVFSDHEFADIDRLLDELRTAIER